MPECTCFELPPEMWHTHYGAVEPGSTHEPNPDCPEHFPKNRQYCKDCLGAGSKTSYGMDFVCPTCDGTGTIHRTGPYSLADGTWSDGVDRTHRINERKFGEANPQRIRIVCQRTLVGVWKPEAMPFQGEIPISWDDFTHAEAIAYADRMARTNQGETNE